MMLCEKCGYETGVLKVCHSCGFDNSSVVIKAVDVNEFNKSKIYISAWLNWTMYIQIFMSSIMIIVSIVSCFIDEPIVSFPIVYLIVSIAIIIISIFVLRLSKKAFIIYVAASVIDVILALLSFNVISVIAKIFFIVYIIQNDWEYFE